VDVVVVAACAEAERPARVRASASRWCAAQDAEENPLAALAAADRESAA